MTESPEQDTTAAINAPEDSAVDIEQLANNPGTPKPAPSRQDSSRASHIANAASSEDQAVKEVSADPVSPSNAEDSENFEDIESDPAWMALWTPE
ncbi:hypothetical protein FGB62_189g018 [Gracilaria domingensis]|nr:hypothetical protein FGB62_189g018 [Gracilaria domingensis]